jgi:3-oxoacyl-[acyl-carrier-protein] synthase III
MPQARIRSIAYHLPEGTLCNADLAARFPEWGVEKISEKTGINVRHIASDTECASDLAVAAAEKLFAESGVPRDSVDTLIFCTQTPDYGLPTSACLIQSRLGLKTSVCAFDFNLGCSGYVYGLGMAHAFIASGQSERVLLLTGDTYTKLLDPEDKTVRTLFGDGATATLVDADEPGAAPAIGPFVYGTEGKGGANLICASTGLRGSEGLAAGRNTLYMNGPEIFNFTLASVPLAVAGLLGKASLLLSDVDLFVFHQANKYMLESIRRKIGIPPERFFISMSESGNTVSSTIPIALRDALDAGVLKPGMRVMLVGFGVGYSWGATLIRW